MTILLASTSPRRRALFERESIDFKAVAPQFNEATLRKSVPEIYVMQLAYQKAMSVPRDGEVVVACDTVVVLDDEILGKPRDRKDAERMLLSLRGREHRVLTGYAILGRSKYVDYDTAYVSFEAFSPEQMKAYLDKGTYGDKAGAYGVQEVESFKITVRGDMDTVVGMPVQRIKDHLIEEKEID